MTTSPKIPSQKESKKHIHTYIYIYIYIYIHTGIEDVVEGDDKSEDSVTKRKRKKKEARAEQRRLEQLELDRKFNVTGRNMSDTSLMKSKEERDALGVPSDASEKMDEFYWEIVSVCVFVLCVCMYIY